MVINPNEYLLISPGREISRHKLLRDICEKCYEMFKEEGRDVQYQDSHENVSSLLMNSSSKSECWNKISMAF